MDTALEARLFRWKTAQYIVSILILMDTALEDGWTLASGEAVALFQSSF